jgi:D-alanyl-D-alanine carboxypeptidase
MSGTQGITGNTSNRGPGDSVIEPRINDYELPGRMHVHDLHATILPTIQLMKYRIFSPLNLGFLLTALTISPVPLTVQAVGETGRRVAEVSEVKDALLKLDIWLEGQRIKYDLPGFSVGVVHDKELIWSKGYGFADIANKIPATDATLYRVASITKTFTAAAVMQLVEEGKLSLEDPVSKYLPWFTPKNADAAHPVRVWNLLTHTAGLQREAPGTDWDKLNGPDIATVVAATAAIPLSMPPLTRLKYSNYGFTVAGELVTAVSGIAYTRHVQERILQPLGMTNSLLLDGTESKPGLAVPYGKRLPGRARGVETQMDKQGILSAGGLVTSVRDLAKWASLQFNESDDFKGPVLTGRSIREMHRPRFLLPDWSQGWSIGWRLTRGEKRAEIGHGGSLPGYKSSLLINPASKVAVILLINAEDGPRELAASAMKIVSGPIEKAATPPETPAAAGDFSNFEGLYRDRSGDFARVVTIGGKLRIIAPETDDIESAMTTLKQTGPNTFLTQARDSAITSGVESVVEFAPGTSGRAASFSGENGGYRYHRAD